MGKSLKGKELGKNISQRKDGRYQARFTNRFGNRQTIYGDTLNEVRAKLREEIYNDEKGINVVTKNVTLDDFEAFTPHTFRHSFATRAIENGMQPKTLSRLLGHKQLQLTMDLYCHVTKDTLVDEMRKMEQKCV